MFLALADLARQRRGLATLQVVFVPAGGSGFWANESYDTGYKAWRLHHLLLPVTTLFPSCRGIATCSSRDDAKGWVRRAGVNIFPDGYTVERPPSEAYQWAHFIAAMTIGEKWDGWHPPARAAAFVDQWLEARARGRKVVTITLREARYHVEHNSNRLVWTEFARGLDSEVYFPVFLRDTEAAFDPLPGDLRGFDVFGEASFNVALRAALYLKAYVNMMTGSGPMFLAWLHPQCVAIVVGMLNFSDYRATPMSLQSVGLEPGRQPSFLPPRQRIVWSDDSLGAIKAAFAEFAKNPARGGEEKSAATALATARRLRLAGRRDAARRIYAHVLHNSKDTLPRTAAKTALASIDWGSAPTGRLGRTLALVRLNRLRLPQTRALSAEVDPNELLELVDWLLLVDRPEDAKVVTEWALAHLPESAEMLRLAGEIELRLGHPAAALTQLERSTVVYPWSAAARYARGLALLLLGRDDEAKAEFHAAALDDPSHEAARLRLRELDPGLVLPEGFTYEDALARRSPGIAGTVGELSFPIALAAPRGGYRVIYFRGLFHALPDSGERTAMDWNRNRPCRLAERFGAVSRWSSELVDACTRPRPVALMARITEKLLFRRIPAAGALSAPTLAAIDRRIAEAQGASVASGLELSPGLR